MRNINMKSLKSIEEHLLVLPWKEPRVNDASTSKIPGIYDLIHKIDTL